MTDLIARLSVLSLLLLPALAFASPHHHATSTVEVDNDFNGKVQVFIGGAYVGTVPADHDAVFAVSPGTRQVTVQTTNGYVLSSQRVHTHAGRSSHVDVVAPPGQLVVSNPNRQSMRVTVGGYPRWIAPFGSEVLFLESGNQRVLTEVLREGRLQAISNDFVWVRPQGRTLETLAYLQPRRPTPGLSYGDDHYHHHDRDRDRDRDEHRPDGGRRS